MKKNRHCPVAIVGRDQPWLLDLAARHAVERDREGPRLGAVIPWRILERAVASAEEDREIAGLQIDDGSINTMVPVKVPSQSEVRACVRTGVVACLERRIAISQKCCTTVLLPIADEQITTDVH